MEKEWILVEYTHYGDDWRDDYREVFEDEEKAKQFEKEHRKEYGGVRGIEQICFFYSNVTEKQLREIITVNEYIKIFPIVKEFLDMLNK